MERNYIRNVSRTPLSFNLPKDSENNYRSLHLAKGEISRALSNSDLGCPEIQKALKGRFVINVTAQMKNK